VPSADTARLIASLELQDKLSPAVNKVVGSVDRLEGATNRASLGTARIAKGMLSLNAATGRTQQSLGKFSQNIQRGVVIGAAAAAGGFIAVVKAAGDFEQQLRTINTVAGLTDEQLKGVGNNLRLIAKTTGVSLDDLTTGYYDLVSAGVKGTLAQEALNDAVKLGIGGIATTAETIDLLTTAINAYGLDAAGAAKATDQFAQAVADGKVKASEIAASFADIASLAKNNKVGIDQIAASYAFLTAKGVPAGEAMTQMQRALLELQKPTGALIDLQNKLGISFLKEAQTKGLVVALQHVREAAAKNHIPLTDLFTRIEGLQFVLNTTGGSFKGYEAELAKMQTANGTAAAQMAERQKGLVPQLNMLREAARDAGITIGSALLPKLTPLVQKLNAFIQANQGKIAEFGDKLATGFEKFAAALQKVDWSPFIDGLKVSSQIAKTAIDLFMGLPDWVKTAAIGGFAVNKLTGGLPTSIVKDVGGAALHQLAERGGNPGRPLFVKEVGLAGAGGPVSSAGGGLKGALGGILKVAVIGVAVDVIAQLAGVLAAQSEANKQTEVNLATQTKQFTGGASLADLKQSLAGVDERIASLDLKNNSNFDAVAFQLNIDGVRDSVYATRAALVTAIQKAEYDGSQAAVRSSERLEAQFGANGDKAAMDARRIEAAENRTGTLIGANGQVISQAIARHISALGQKFGRDLHSLRAATKPVDIAKFARAIAADVAKGAGSVAGTKGVIKDLKVKLAGAIQAHDPKTAAILRAAIRGVQAKLPNREWVASQVASAKKIVGSGESQKRKLDQLQAIEKSLRAHGDTHAAKTVAKLEAIITGTKSVKTAALETRQAIKDKDLSVVIPLTTNVVVTNGAISKVRTTAGKISGKKA
jgi:TP901 family phage tail tape measure protein